MKIKLKKKEWRALEEFVMSQDCDARLNFAKYNSDKNRDFYHALNVIQNELGWDNGR